MVDQIRRKSFRRTESTVTNERGRDEFVIQFVDLVEGENEFQICIQKPRRIRVTFRVGSGCTIQSEYWKDGWVVVFGPRQYTGMPSSAMRLSKLDKEAEKEEILVMDFLEGA